MAITNELYIDTNDQNELFLFETSEGSTPSLRVYIYENGTAISLAATNTAKFIYTVDRDATEIVEVDGTVVAGLNYIDFDFTVEKTAINGKFLASVIVYDESLTPNTMVVQSDGMAVLKRNPALDGATILDTTTTINWGLYTNIPPFPWSISNTQVNITDCDESPKQLTAADSSYTQYVEGACDFVFWLPKATTANIGRVYSMMHDLNNYTITIYAQDGDTIHGKNDQTNDNKAVSVRNYNAGPPSIYIRQVTASKYRVVFAGGAFLYSEEDIFSSSSGS